MNTWQRFEFPCCKYENSEKREEIACIGRSGNKTYQHVVEKSSWQLAKAVGKNKTVSENIFFKIYNHMSLYSSSFSGLSLANCQLLFANLFRRFASPLDWKSTNPKILVISHDPGLQKSNYIAGYVIGKIFRQSWRWTRKLEKNFAFDRNSLSHSCKADKISSKTFFSFTSLWIKSKCSSI